MFDFAKALKELPEKPGVYLMKNSHDEVIYVGKAVVLKNRVRSYFQSPQNQTPKVRAMMPHVAEFEYIVTDSEVEALILENNLIKKFNPHYNILLKDDKTYPYIKVTLNEAFPRVFSTRRQEKDGARYFGPMTDGLAAKETLELIHRIWPLRTCTRVLPRDIGKERPCLNQHIGRCLAPCAGGISQAEYQKMIDGVLALLEGKDDQVIQELKAAMEAASDALEFEKAAEYRDKIYSLNAIRQRQKMANTGLGDTDVIAAQIDGENALVQVFFIRGGKMTGREHYSFTLDSPEEKRDLITAFVGQFYAGTAFVPREILLEEPLSEGEAEPLIAYLSQQKGAKVAITVPKIGEKKRLVELARQNAAITLTKFGEKLKRERARTEGAMEELRQALGLPEPFRRLESYDISHTQGFASVGSMVVFEDGLPKRSDYRKFRLRSVQGPNDFAAMDEVLTRRLNHEVVKDSTRRFGRLPDLILMDGGKPQITAAREALARYGLSVPVCGMVKDDAHRTQALLYQDREIPLPKHSEAFQLVTRVQDEVHRFAITYHRKLREDAMLHSVLEDIPGIGPARRKAMMAHFKDIGAIAAAEVADLLEVPGMTIPAAESVYRFFHTSEEAE